MFPNFEIEGDNSFASFDQKSLNESLRSYFRQVSYYLSLLVPLFGENSFRLRPVEPLRKQIVEYDWPFKKAANIDHTDEEQAALSEKIVNYVYEKSFEYDLSNGLHGECKYCSLLNIDLSELGPLKHGLDHYIKKTLKTNQEYSKIITRIQIEDKPDLYLNRIYYSIMYQKRLYLNRIHMIEEHYRPFRMKKPHRQKNSP